MATFDAGYFHLTQHGWKREDVEPFPQDRLETWQYESETPSEAAKEQIHLVRLWSSDSLSAAQRAQLRSKFGYPVSLSQGRHITIDCRD